MAQNTTSRRKSAAAVPGHLADRVKAFQKRLRTDDLDGMLLTHALDIRYLTGFVGEDSWCWVPARGSKPTVISDLRFKAHIPEEAPHVRVCMRGTFDRKRESLADAAARLLPKQKIGRIGIAPGHLSVPVRKAMTRALGGKRLKDYDDGLLAQRSVKDAIELAAIRKAVKIQQQAFMETRAFIEVGKTENEVAAFLEYRMRSLGASGPGFNSIVAFDGHASHSHAIPGGRKVKKNSSILIDWGACVDGYRSDMTRVLNMGRPKKHIADIYKVVEEALHAGIDAVGPGVSLKQVDDASRNVMKKHGYELDHGLGHGIGLNIHEQPGIGQHEDRFLVPGQVITIEPGIYLGERGGVRLEDDILVTKTGFKNLCDLPTDLDWTIL
ncbi:MAG: Xaa-Pro peptidase family protein [Planctomycetota bacterium]